MDSPFLAAIFALSAAAAWGSGDFTGGLAARRVGPFPTVLISYTVGLLVLVIVALARFEMLPPLADLLWGALAGLFGLVGLGFLLRGFATGRMGIVAPVSAVLATAIPVILATFTEGMPHELQLLGFGLALVGIWLLSRPERLGGHPAGLGMALLAGLGFGAFFTALDQVGESAVFWPLVAGRLAACAADGCLRPFHAPAGHPAALSAGAADPRRSARRRRQPVLPAGNSEWAAGRCRGVGLPLSGGDRHPGLADRRGTYGPPPGDRRGCRRPGDCVDHNIKVRCPIIPSSPTPGDAGSPLARYTLVDLCGAAVP